MAIIRIPSWRRAAAALALLVGALMPSVAAAAPPGTFATAITVQNPTQADAHVTVTFINPDGTVAKTMPWPTNNGVIKAGQSGLLYLPNITDLPAGRYSAYVDSDQSVRVIENLAATNPVSSDACPGISQTDVGTTFYVPQVFRSYYQNSSTVTVQNADTTSASVTVKYMSPSGTQVAQETQTISAGAAYQFDQGANASLSRNFVGSAVITSDKNVAAIFNAYADAGATGGPTFSCGQGLSTGSAIAYAPMVMNNYYGNNTSMVIQNTDTKTADVSVTYTGGGTTKTRTFSIAPGSSQLLYTPNEGLPDGFNGSAVVTATNSSPLLTVVNVANPTTGDLAAYVAFKEGATTVNLPVLMKSYSTDGWATSFLVQNVDTAVADVTVTYSNGTTETGSIQPGASRLFYQPNNANLPSGFNGSAILTSSKKIVAVVNERRLTSNGPGDVLLTYPGFAG